MSPPHTPSVAAAEVPGADAAEQRMRRRMQVLRSVWRITRGITQEHEPQRLLDDICQALAATPGYAGVWVGLADHDGALVRPAAWAGEGEGMLAPLQLGGPGPAPDDTPARRAICARLPAVVPDLAAEPEGAPWRAAALGRGWVGLAAVPLAQVQCGCGVLCVASSQVGLLDDEEIALLEDVAAELAFGLHMLEEEARRRQAEESLRESEERYRSLFDHIALGIFESTPDGHLLRANAAYARMFGFASPEEARQSIVDVAQSIYVHPENRPRFVRHVLEHPGMASFENEYRRRDGTTFIGALKLQAIRRADGQASYLFGLVEDITERQRMEQALRASEARYRLISENTADVIWMLDLSSGRFSYVSPSVQRLRGFTPEEVLAQTMAEALTPASFRNVVEHLPARIAAVEAGDETVRTQGQELDQQCKDGSVVPTEVVSTLLQDERGRVRYILGVTRNITERKQAEAALYAERSSLARRVAERTADLSRANADLARAMRLKDEFLAMMSHELRTPLNTMLMVAEAFEEGFYGPITERQRQALSTLGQSGRHLLAILSDILDLARIAAGAEAMDPQPLAVETLCQSALQFVRATAKQKGISLRRTIEVGVVGLRADERRLTQILVNLLDNAVKFTPEGGTVGLQVISEAAQERIQFAVWDTGIGIAKADYDQLFEPFTQVDGGLSRQYGGIGLGLTLVRRLVDLHGGSVSVASAPGQGSRFTISLPWAADDNLDPEVRRPQPQPVVWARPPRLVLADDHEITLSCYTELLSQHGFQVSVARTGAEAVSQVREICPEVVVMDLQMPELSGLEAIRQIRGDPAVAAVPIIALTALAMPEDREQCLAAGASVYLAKPVSLRALVATIIEVLQEQPQP